MVGDDRPYCSGECVIAAAADRRAMWRALDAPFRQGDWQPTPGRCSRCGQPALSGITRWWHLGDDCRATTTATFIADRSGAP